MWTLNLNSLKISLFLGVHFSKVLLYCFVFRLPLRLSVQTWGFGFLDLGFDRPISVFIGDAELSTTVVLEDLHPHFKPIILLINLYILNI